jgi:chromosome segregation ATPase
VTESRDELETKDRESQERFVTLQSKVDQKVEEFELTHSGDKEAIARLQDTQSGDKEAIARLQEQVKSLQQELQDTLVTVEDLKNRLKEKEEGEETVEELARQNQQSVDCQINKLQTEMTKNHVAEGDYKKKIQSYEDMIDSMQMEMEENLEEKEREIEELKRSVESNKIMIDRLTREKDQLVLSMNDMTSSRRDEIDELQTELMGMSTRAANQAREVQAVKLQLEESSYRKEEVERLRSRVRELGDQLTSRDGARTHEKTALEVENSELRQKFRQLSTERQAAEDKLRGFVEDKQGGSKSIQVLRERNAVLKFEVEKLTKKLKKFAERKTPTNANTVAERFMI